MTRFDAVIWDFDGTILDTESPAFDAAAAEYERHGLSISLDRWQETIGSAAHDPWWHALRDELGGDLGEDPDALVARWRSVKRAITDAADARPGVRPWLDACGQRGLPVAVASSSPIEWVERHTTRLDIRSHFSSLTTSTDVGVDRTKPHPDLFLLAAERLGVVPDRCLAIEDSAHGVTAAKAAGMTVVVCPNPITASMDFRHADAVFDSLADADPVTWLGR